MFETKNIYYKYYLVFLNFINRQSLFYNINQIVLENLKTQI